MMNANVLLQECLFYLFREFQVRCSDSPTCHDEQQQKPRLIWPTEVRLSPDLSGHPSTLIKLRPSCRAFTPSFLPHPPKFSRASHRGGFLVLTLLSPCPECLGESLGHVGALLLVQINRTHVSRCIFSQFLPLLFTTHADDFQITVPSSRWCQRHSAPRPHQTLHLPPLMSWFHNVFWTQPAQV